MPRIEVDRLTKRYGAVTAVDELSFVLEPGSITGFIGANGAGKSTALRMLLGLTRPTSGSATIDGRPYHRLDAPARVVGALTDPDVFHPGRSGRSSLRVLGVYCGVGDSRVDEVLDLVGLADDGERRVGQYSMGMRQRLGLGAVLLADPPALVLDEPANGLDPLGIHWLRGLLRGLADAGRTILVSSHQLAELGHTVDDVVVVHRGRLIARGSTTELMSRHQAASLEDLFLDLVAQARP